MDTRPLYFGKIFFHKPKAEKAWAALLRNVLIKQKDGAFGRAQSINPRSADRAK